ncbi:hypothetical protein GCM10027598_08400 [Amycolatopsis oliviviridis]|uniref:DUF4145 domain-containing protein n=1 Tax=Amycolatopsis oliviviridis TaxID=1471590 RepID=A0ABQ3LMV3_9PSEU|nr:DUF4145 domain-containing protein [Amycolatopsis oliviviridis]GHH21120.1 hypothetical protein GCM10017790_41810 [Amycolatopsis oliviviridis]
MDTSPELRPHDPIPLEWHVMIERVFPDAEDTAYSVGHLPDDIGKHLKGAIRVLQAGVPSAAAVQLRRTLEAAAAAKGVNEPRKPLVHSIQKLISEGYVTKDFEQVLSHVRKVGNMGAHHTDEDLSESDARRALLFTVQFLRNLFEVPGELMALESDGEESGDSSKESTVT